eukprot:scaffold15472_cov117-Cylindrotheca_fusiformis.AAC.7
MGVPSKCFRAMMEAVKRQQLRVYWQDSRARRRSLAMYMVEFPGLLKVRFQKYQQPILPRFCFCSNRTDFACVETDGRLERSDPI